MQAAAIPRVPLKLQTIFKHSIKFRRWRILTRVASAKSDIASTLHQLKDKRITNILALRGDVPQGMNLEDAVKDYRYAYQLIEDIKSQGILRRRSMLSRRAYRMQPQNG